VEPVEVLRERFPTLEILEWRAIEAGWDSLVLPPSIAPTSAQRPPNPSLALR
jgi:hypothetical protein